MQQRFFSCLFLVVTAARPSNLIIIKNFLSLFSPGYNFPENIPVLLEPESKPGSAHWVLAYHSRLFSRLSLNFWVHPPVSKPQNDSGENTQPEASQTSWWHHGVMSIYDNDTDIAPCWYVRPAGYTYRSCLAIDTHATKLSVMVRVGSGVFPQCRWLHLWAESLRVSVLAAPVGN